MAATTIFRSLLLPSLNFKKTLGYTVLLPPKNLSCVTSQFYQFTSGPIHYGEPTKPNFILTKDIPNYFCNPETLTIDGYKFIEKAQLEEVTKGFKQYNNRIDYIMPDGIASREAKYKKKYKYKVSKKFYMDENDAKKRMSVTNIEVLDPDSGHSNFKTDTLIYQCLKESPGLFLM